MSRLHLAVARGGCRWELREERPPPTTLSGLYACPLVGLATIGVEPVLFGLLHAAEQVLGDSTVRRQKREIVVLARICDQTIIV